jgi:hypothetical protein
MTIETLLKAIPVPATPFEAYVGPWRPIEAALGTALPQDYKDFIRLYGNGRFLDFLGIGVPVSRCPNLQLVSQAQIVSNIFRAIEEPAYPLWPAPGGLLSFGSTDNGHNLYWSCRGPPDDWGVVVWDPGMGDYERFDCDLTDFLAGLITGDVVPKSFPEELLPCDYLFTPYSYRDFGEFRMSWRVSYGGAPTDGPNPEAAGVRDREGGGEKS